MSPSAAGYHLAVLAIICTLAIFFFPLVSGPYPVTHGPATDFETVLSPQLIAIVIALAALATLVRAVHSFVSLTFSFLDFPSSLSWLLPESRFPTLRC